MLTAQRLPRCQKLSEVLWTVQVSTCAAPIRHSPDQQPPEARTTSGTLPSPRKCCDTDLGLLDPGDDSSQPLISLLQRSRRPRGLVYWLRDQAVAHSMQQESLLDAQPFAVAHAQTKLDREPFTRPFAQGTALPDSASHSDQSSAVPALSLKSGSARSVFCSRQHFGVYKSSSSGRGRLSYLRYGLSFTSPTLTWVIRLLLQPVVAG
ncbi:hypothetical protein ABBQ38_009858 [Trebouxia sp. C0009 RCD-2024]